MSGVSPNTIVISNISPALEKHHFVELFECCGPVIDCQLSLLPNGERECEITFAKPDIAQAAKLLNGTTLADRPLKVVMSAERAATAAITGGGQPPPLPAGENSAPLLSSSVSAGAAPPPAALPPPLPSAAVPMTPLQVAQQQFLALQADNPNDPFLTSRTVYVGNLSPYVGDADLKQFFGSVGTVIATRLSGTPDLQTGASRYCFVEFSEQLSAVAALSLTGALFMDRCIKVGKANAPITGHGRQNVSKAMSAMFDVSAAVQNLDPKKVTAAMEKVRTAQALIAAKLSGADPATIAALQAASILAAENAAREQALLALQAAQQQQSSLSTPESSDANGKDKEVGDNKDGKEKSSSSSRRSSSRSRSRSSRSSRRRRSRSSSRSRSRNRGSRHRHDRSRSRDRDRRRDRDRDRHRSRSRDRRRRDRDRHRSRSSSISPRHRRRNGGGGPGRRRPGNNNDHPGMVWDGFQWNPAPQPIDASMIQNTN